MGNGVEFAARTPGSWGSGCDQFYFGDICLWSFISLGAGNQLVEQHSPARCGVLQQLHCQLREWKCLARSSASAGRNDAEAASTNDCKLQFTYEFNFFGHFMAAGLTLLPANAKGFDSTGHHLFWHCGGSV